MPKEADVCLILEGTYPYVVGGVSSWAHDVIRSHPDLTFTLICLNAPNEKKRQMFELPENVIGKLDIELQKIPEGIGEIPSKDLETILSTIRREFTKLNFTPNLESLQAIVEALSPYKGRLNEDILLNSNEAWEMMVEMYHQMMEDASFNNYFWTWRCLLSGFYSILLTDFPKAKIYHALCTGYAGLLLARIKLETGNSTLLTEHGIYTNERRIEITATSWLNDQRAMDMSIDGFSKVRDLKDFWVDAFSAYSKITYDASDKIVTLYEGNKELQILDGADPSRISIVRNGIDYAYFSSLPRNIDHPPTVALIGRVVPIKDIKTFLYAMSFLVKKVPNLRAWILGNTDEDEDYYEECLELCDRLKLQNTVKFLGEVKVGDYLPEIDAVVLTSISEGQPLSLLEAGACGIPCISTDVGSCSEIIFGAKEESPKLGKGGMICSLSSPGDFAEGCFRLLTDTRFREECSDTIQKRVQQYYDKSYQDARYNEIYQALIARVKVGVH